MPPGYFQPRWKVVIFSSFGCDSGGIVWTHNVRGVGVGILGAWDDVGAWPLELRRIHGPRSPKIVG